MTTWESPRRQPQPSVQDLLKELLLARDYRPGDRLPTEAELGGELGVSRSAAREALRGLETLGIVEIRQGHGMRLREMSLDGLAEGLAFWTLLSERDGLHAIRPIAYVRDVLETSCIGEVIGRHEEEHVAAMRAAVEEMRERARDGEYAPEADRRFHRALFEPLGNWVFTYILDAFWEASIAVLDTRTREASTGRRPSRIPPVDVADNHAEILRALTDNDEAAALAAIRQHFDNTSLEDERRPAPRGRS